MRTIVVLILFIFWSTATKGQSYSQSVEIISSGGQESSDSNYSNFGIIGTAFINYSSVTDNYKNLTGFINSAVVVDTIRPRITLIKNPRIFNADSSGLFISFNVFDENSIDSVIIYYRNISENSSFQNTFYIFKDTVNHLFQSSIFKDIGIEWKAKAVDNAGNIDSTDLYQIYVYYPQISVPMSYGSNQDKYQIIAFPVNRDINGNNLDIESQLEDAFGDYQAQESRKWRMFEYNYNRNKDKDEFPEFDEAGFEISTGNGYWLIVKNTMPLIIRGALFLDGGNGESWNLKYGWNIVGNPYPFNISWNDIRQFNDYQTDSMLITYFNGKYDYHVDILNPFQGGFIFSNSVNDISLKIPPFKNPDIQLRRSDKIAKDKPSKDLKYPDWFVPISVSISQFGNNISGIGMHSEANHEIDQYDYFVLPRFMNFIDINFHHPLSKPSRFSRDIRSVSNEETWKFTVETNTPGDMARLEWDPERISGLLNNLVLLNMQNLATVDMKAVGSYEFRADDINYFKIIYGNNEYIIKNILPENIFFGDPYPNPAYDRITIPVAAPDDRESYNVEINIIDTRGIEIRKVINGPINPGFYKIDWDCKTEAGFQAGRGLYICQMIISGIKNKYSMYKRIILK